MAQALDRRHQVLVRPIVNMLLFQGAGFTSWMLVGEGVALVDSAAGGT